MIVKSIFFVLSLALTLLCAAAEVKAAPSLVFPFSANWEILRSGFNNTLDVALEADTYGEEWTLEVRPDDGILLRTPRGTIKAVGVKSSDDPAERAPFDLLVINEKQLAQLFGIQEDSLAPLGREIFLDFRSEGPEEQTFTFKANPKYFVSVVLHLQL